MFKITTCSYVRNQDVYKRQAYKGTILVSIACALIAGIIGTLIGYAVSKKRRSKWASYVNSMAFLPYLMPSIAVGAAFFILFSNKHINLFNTYTLLVIVGVIKYIPFASRNACLLYTSSAEDYLEAILVIQQRKGIVHSIDVAEETGFSKRCV